MKRYGLRSTGETDTHDYFDKVLSRKGAAPATGRDTLIQLQGRVARKLDTHDSENRLAGLPPRITRITNRHPALHRRLPRASRVRQSSVKPCWPLPLTQNTKRL